MKKVIFTQEWIALHPYEKADETDLYYTELANEIYHALDEACYTHNFKIWMKPSSWHSALLVISKM